MQIVKRIFTILSLALILGSGAAVAQNAAMKCPLKPSPDAKLISTWRDGNYKVCRWWVRETQPATNDEFSLRYRLNISKMISSYDRNAEELEGFHSFMEELAADTTKQVLRINITGYASPDGPDAINERLAKSRAEDVRRYINNKYAMTKYGGTTNGVALLWSDAAAATRDSDIPMKSQVLSLMQSDHSQMDIEAKLQAMPSAWTYLKDKILPPMRCVEMHIVFSSWEIVETRTAMQQPEAMLEEVTVNNFYIIEPQPEDNMLVANDFFAPIDFPSSRDCSCTKRQPHHREEILEKLHLRRRHGRMIYKQK